MARVLWLLQMLNRKRHTGKMEKKGSSPEFGASVKTRHRCAEDEQVLQERQCLFLGFMRGRHLKLAVKVDDVTINELSD